MIRNYPKTFYTKTISRAIRAITGSYYNHVAVVAGYAGERWVYEAVDRGFVRTWRLEEWLKRENVDFDFVAFNPPVPHNFRERLYLIEGVPYDFGSLLVWQLIRHICLKVLKKDVWLGRRGFKALARVYCSEAIAFLFGKERWWTWGPKEVHDGFLPFRVYETKRPKK